MSKNALTIVPIKLHSENDSSFASSTSSSPLCSIKWEGMEISFFQGVDEPIIQTILKELKPL